MVTTKRDEGVASPESLLKREPPPVLHHVQLRSHRDFCLADRAQVTMTSPFMRAYALLLVKTCHRRNAPAMGGMAAQIPIRHDPAAAPLAATYRHTENAINIPHGKGKRADRKRP